MKRGLKMENEKTPEQKIEELVSFDPILYTKGRHTYIYAKFDNRLFRITYNKKKPVFAVLTPTSIGNMTMDDIYNILYHCDDDNNTTDYLVELPELFKTSKALFVADPKQGPYLYKESCRIIVESPDFKIVKKKHKTAERAEQERAAAMRLQQPAKQTVSPNASTKPVSATPVTQNPSPVVTKNTVVTPQPTPSAPSNSVSIAPKTKEENAARMRADRERWANQEVVDLISKPKKKAKNVLSIPVIAPMVRPKDDIKQSETPAPAIYTPLVTPAVETKSEPTTVERVSDLPQSVSINTPIEAETIKQPEPAPQKQELIQSTPHAEMELKNDVVPTIPNGFLLLTTDDWRLPEIASASFEVPSLLIDFYGTGKHKPNFKSFYTISTLQKAVALQTQDLKNPVCQEFDFPPQVFNNQTVVFKVGDECVVLSFNPKQPTSSIRNVKTGAKQDLTWPEIERFLDILSREKPILAEPETRAKFKTAHDNGMALLGNNYFPTPQQVIAEHDLRAMMRKKASDNIQPTFCVGNIIVARQGNKYLKVVVGNTPVFEVYRNGVVSPMTVDEFQQFYKDLYARYTIRQINHFGAGTLKKQFKQSMIRSKETKTTSPDKVTSSETLKSTETVRTTVMPVRAVQLKPTPAPTPIVIPVQKTVAESMKDAQVFFAADIGRADFRTEEELHHLRLACATQNPEVKIKPLTPLIDRANFLYYEKNDVLYIISLNVNNPCFFKKKGRSLWPMRLADLHQILDDILPQNTIYKELFTTAFLSHKKQDEQRPHKAIPSIGQVLEKAYYESLLAGKDVLQPIEVTYCAENIVIAYSDNVFYKITLNPLSYGAYENGRVRSMRKDEIRRVNGVLLKKYNMAFLIAHNASGLLRRAETGISPVTVFEAPRPKKTPLEEFVDTFEEALKAPKEQLTQSSENETVIVSEKSVDADKISEPIAEIQSTEPLVEMRSVEQVDTVTDDMPAEIEPTEPQITEAALAILEAEVRDAFSFWPEPNIGSDWKYQEEIENLFQLLSPQAKGLFTPLRFPFVTQHNCLFYRDGKDKYLISLDADKPYYRHYDKNESWRWMTGSVFSDVMAKAVAGAPESIASLSQLEEIFNENKNKPKVVLSAVQSFPTTRQLLAYSYMRALQAGRDTLPDIEPQLLTNKCLVAKKGNIFYKIVTSTPHTFTALENGQTRLMTPPEVEWFFQELKKTHSPIVLQKQGIRSFYRRFKTNPQMTTERYDTADGQSIKELFDFNGTALLTAKLDALTRQATQRLFIEKEDESDKIFLSAGDTVSLADFWRDRNPRPNMWYHYKIVSIQSQIDKTPLPEIEPVITQENYLFFKRGVRRYFVSVDLDAPVFVYLLENDRRYQKMLPAEINNIITELFAQDVQKRNTVLQKIAAVYQGEQSKKDSNRGLPTIAQALEMHRLESILENTADSDIPATLCANNVIIARKDDVYYRVALGEVPICMRWRDGVIEPMSGTEVSWLQSQFAKRYGRTVRERIGQLSANDTNTFRPFIFKEGTPQSVADEIWQIFENSPIQPASMADTKNLFGYIEDQAQKANTVANRPFIEDSDKLPDYDLLYKIEFLKYRLLHGVAVGEKDFTIPPTLCSDGRLHYKDGPFIYSFTLDENKPFFICRSVVTSGQIVLSPEKLDEIVDMLQTIPEKAKKLKSYFRALYQKWKTTRIKNLKSPAPFPRFDQQMEYRALEARLQHKELPEDILPIIGNGNILYAHYNDVYFKIRMDDPMAFEALEGNIVRLMTFDELNRIIDDVYRNRQIHNVNISRLREAFEVLIRHRAPMRQPIETTGISFDYTLPSGEETADLLLKTLEQNNNQEAKVATPTDMLRLTRRLKELSQMPETRDNAFAAFYEHDKYSVSFEWVLKNETLKRALQTHNLDLEAPENTTYTLPPIYGNDDRIYFKNGEDYGVISLIDGKLFFMNRRPKPFKHLPLTLSEAQELLMRIAQSDSALQEEIRTYLPDIYTQYCANPPKGGVIISLPRFEQVEEHALLTAQLNGEVAPDKIEPTVCAGMLLCAKYGNKYCKITLTDNPVFEVLENGIVREMRADEFSQIIQDVPKKNLYTLLQQQKIESLKRAFYHRRGKSSVPTGETAMKSFVGKKVVIPHLPVFAHLIIGKKETVDIPVTHCADNAIYMRQSGVYYKISLAKPIKFEALESGQKRQMTRAELDMVLVNLNELYDESYIRQLGLTDLSTVFENGHTNTTMQSEIVMPVITPTPVIVPVPTNEPTPQAVVTFPLLENTEIEPRVKRRGRPRKVAVPETPVVETLTPQPTVEPEVEPKVKRGRSKKVAPPLTPEEPVSPVKEKNQTVQETIPETGVSSAETVVSVPTMKPKCAPKIRTVTTPKLTSVAPPKQLPERSEKGKNIEPKQEKSEETTTQTRVVIQKPKERLLTPEEIKPWKKPIALTPRRSIRPSRDDWDDDIVDEQPKESPEDKLRSLIFASVPQSYSVVPTYPAAEFPQLPETMMSLPQDDYFFPTSGVLPDFSVLYMTHLFNMRYQLGNKSFPQNEDILSFDIEPVLCNQNILFAKRGKWLYQISLDTENPRFVIRDLINKTNVKMPLKNVQEILTQWVGDEIKVNQMMKRLTPVHQEYIENGVITPLVNVLPSMQQIFQLYAARSAYIDIAGLSSERLDKNFFAIPPTRCAGNIIFFKTGETFYRICIDETVRFERLKGDEAYLMTGTELYFFIRKAQQAKTFPADKENEIFGLLKSVYRATHEPLFDEYKMNQISLVQQQQIKTDPVKFYMQRFGMQRED